MLHLRPHKRTIRGYYFASSIEEALAYLMAHHGRSLVVGGGTSLMPMLQSEAVRTDYLADVSRVASIRRIAEHDGALLVGGAVTFERLLLSEAIARHAPILCDAAQQMSTPQIRQLATLAGNVVSAQGNSQGAVALMALDADVEITNSTGPQWLPMSGLFVGRGISRVDSTTEIVTAIRFPALVAGQGVALGSLRAINGAYRPPLVLALNLTLREDKQSIEWGHIVVGSTSTAPTRVPGLEETLLDLDPDDSASGASLGEAIRDEAIEQRWLAETPGSASHGLVSLAADVLARALAMARHSSSLESPH